MSIQSLRSGDTRVQRLEQAGLWLQRLKEPRQDSRVVEAWLDWCQSDPLNQQAFDELAAVWELSAGLAPEPGQVDTRSGSLHPRRRALVASLAVLALTAVGGGAWWLTQPAQEQVLTSDLSSPTGVNSASTLQDGSLLELGGGTRVTVRIGPRTRRVQLHEGELFVAVRPQAERPFSVDADRLEVTATGTAFNVLRTDERTTVTVAEGSVDARFKGEDATAPMQQLQAGQQLVYFHTTHRVVVRQTDPRDAIAWRTGTLHFQNQPLSEVIATVNRYAAKRILIEDPQVAAMTFTGTARTDRIEGWMRGLSVAFPVMVEALADGRQRIIARPGASSD
jgi:transmembrane sensor